MTGSKNNPGPTGKALGLLKEVIALHGKPFHPETISKKTGVPVANLYRYLNSFLEARLLIHPARGEYLPHPSFLSLLSTLTSKEVLDRVIRPKLERLVRILPTTLHFGVLESEMVTYLIKVSPKGQMLFTKENMQLEAYCSSIGKVLLAAMQDADIKIYLEGDSFPALTRYTITDPERIKAEILKTRQRGYGIDDREIHEDLFCLAVPVVSTLGETIGAISAASNLGDLLAKDIDLTLKELRAVAKNVGSVF